MQNPPDVLNTTSQKVVEVVVLEKSLTLTTPPKLTILGIFALMNHHDKSTPSASLLSKNHKLIYQTVLSSPFEQLLICRFFNIISRIFF